jgi:phage tail protein X
MEVITYRSKQNDVVDWICWKHYGFTSYAVEEVLKTNPNVSEYDDFLPEGLLVNLPEMDKAKSLKQIKLWD